MATQVSHLPPVSTVFAALLGYNPVQHLLESSGVLARLPARNVAMLTGRHFFPTLIAGPFHHGLVIVFTAAALMSFTGAMVSLMRGKQFYYEEPAAAAPQPGQVPGPAPAVPEIQAPNGTTAGHRPAPGPASPVAGGGRRPARPADRTAASWPAALEARCRAGGGGVEAVRPAAG